MLLRLFTIIINAALLLSLFPMAIVFVSQAYFCLIALHLPAIRSYGRRHGQHGFIPYLFCSAA
jgi:hypothetical protein